MATPTEKGNALEAAVATIESYILETSPALREKTFVIESKKIVIVDGVRHEIDIYVTIDLAAGYRSVYIFECKNWQDPVGKNEVIVLSEKIDATQAQHGYLIGKSFTKDAQAQALKDRRMTLSTATEHDPATAPLPYGFHGVQVEAELAEAKFHVRGRTHSELVTLDLCTVNATLLGEVIDLRHYLAKWAEDASSSDVLSFRSDRFPEGTHVRAVESRREFAVGELLLDDRDIEVAENSVRYKVHIVRPSVVSYFEVESRGRVVSLTPIHLPSGPEMRVKLISH